MKKSLIILMVLSISGILSIRTSLAGDNDFNGIIVYNITYSGSKVTPQMESMMPKTVKIKIKGEKSRTEMNMGMGSTNVIFDGATQTSITLMDMMGQKLAMKMTAVELEEELKDAPEVEVENTSETKEIAGYTCKKAIVKVHEKNSDKVTEQIVYYTDKLGPGYSNMDNPLFKSIDGVMLEYSMEDKGISMQFTAISVEKKKIADSEFEIPEDYKVVTKSEFQNMFGGY